MVQVWDLHCLLLSGMGEQGEVQLDQAVEEGLELLSRGVDSLSIRQPLDGDRTCLGHPTQFIEGIGTGRMHRGDGNQHIGMLSSRRLFCEQRGGSVGRQSGPSRPPPPPHTTVVTRVRRCARSHSVLNLDGTVPGTK